MVWEKKAEGLEISGHLDFLTVTLRVQAEIETIFEIRGIVVKVK